MTLGIILVDWFIDLPLLLSWPVDVLVLRLAGLPICAVIDRYKLLLLILTGHLRLTAGRSQV